MAAELQPAVELAMMRQQAAATIGRDDPGGARDVAGPARAVEAIPVRFDERGDAIDDGRFRGEKPTVAGQHVEQVPAVHGGKKVCRCQVSGQGTIIILGHAADN